MPESAEEFYARVTAEADQDGRFPTPPIAEWDIFPWDIVDGRLATRPLAPPAPEEPRLGEGGEDCFLCADDVPGVIWTNERWRVKHLRERSGLPLVLMLEPIEHLDLPDLDEEMAAELGTLSVRLARILEGLTNIARCHVYRFGDGAAHLHVWFSARPERLGSLRGSYDLEWDQFLPPGPEDVWRADLQAVAAAMAEHGGRAVL
jgi:hypothetical protein